MKRLILIALAALITTPVMAENWAGIKYRADGTPVVTSQLKTAKAKRAKTSIEANKPFGMTDSCFATYKQKNKPKWNQRFGQIWDGANGETCRLRDPCQGDKACERKRDIEDRKVPILKSRPCRLKEPCPPDGWIHYYE